MWVLLVVSILFLAGSLSNFLVPGGDIQEGLAGLAISVVAAGCYLFFRSQEKQSDVFLVWLAENAIEVRSDHAVYRGMPITFTQEVTQFQAVLSFLIATVTLRSRYYFLDHERVVLPSLVYTLATLIFGWWGIPYGPLHTVRTLYNNLIGGHEQRISDLLEHVLEAEEMDASEDGD